MVWPTLIWKLLGTDLDWRRDWPDFGSKDGHMTMYQNFANSKWRTAAIFKIVFGYISTIYCPINVKFDMKKQNYVQIQVTWPKYQNLKIQDGGRPPFWKLFHQYIQLRIIWFQWNLVCRCIIWFQERSIIKVSKFYKLKWRTAALFVSDYMSAYRSGGCSELIGDVLLCWLSYKDKSAICTH